MDWWMDEVGGWISRLVDGWIDKWMDEWTETEKLSITIINFLDRRVDGWVDRYGWIDQLIKIWVNGWRGGKSAKFWIKWETRIDHQNEILCLYQSIIICKISFSGIMDAQKTIESQLRDILRETFSEWVSESTSQSVRGRVTQKELF